MRENVVQCSEVRIEKYNCEDVAYHFSVKQM